MTEKKKYKASNVFEIAGSSLKRKTRTCPKCGQGVYMAKHKNRVTCGKCGYTEFQTSS